MSRQNVKQPPATPAPTRYEDDFYTWIAEQIALLKAGKTAEIDALNIAEELSDAANGLRDKLEGAIATLTQNLLQWDHKPLGRCRSWEIAISEQRRRISRLVKRNPGLKSVLEEGTVEGYLDGRDRALAETGLPEKVFATACPYSFDEMMTRTIELNEAEGV